MSPAHEENESNASIVEVAALAHVSTATVSRVLSGRRTKDDDISKRVKNAAEQLNYAANYAASALRSDTTRSYGLLIETDQDAFTSQMVDALEQETEAVDKQLMLAIASDAQTRSERLAVLASRRIDGLIVIAKGADRFVSSPVQHNANGMNRLDGDEISEFARTHHSIPVVQVAGVPPTLHANWVGTDDSGAMRLAIDHLTARNASALALLEGPMESESSTTMFATFQSASDILDLYTEPQWSTFGPHTVMRGYRDAMNLFAPDTEHKRVPEGLICTSMHVAIGARMALQQLSIDVPNNVKIICITSNKPITDEELEFTTISPPYGHMAKEAIRLLESRKSPRWLPVHTAFPPYLTQRESTRSPRFGTSDMEQPDDSC